MPRSSTAEEGHTYDAQRLLATVPDVDVMAAVGDGDEAVRRSVELQPDVVFGPGVAERVLARGRGKQRGYGDQLTDREAEVLAKMAEALDCPLVTADARLVTAPGIRCTIELVSQR